jgi:hypothetical protein
VSRHVIPRAQRAALHHLERSGKPVVIGQATADALCKRGFLVPVGITHWTLSDKGRAFIAAMDDPTLTHADLLRMYHGLAGTPLAAT